MTLLLAPEQIDEAQLLYVEHEWPVADIAEHFGVSNNAVANALRSRGVEMRPRYTPPPPMRMKQCARCLHFLPLALFSGRDATRARLASWCMNCTEQPKDPKWEPNPAPLTAAISQWRNA